MATRSKLQRILNCVPSRKTYSDWTSSNAKKAGILKPELKPGTEVDLRRPWWKIQDQKDTGSCVGWAVADGSMRWHCIESGLIKPEVKLSVRYLWMASKETDEFKSQPTTFLEIEGTSIKAALDIVRKYGMVTDDILPFNSTRLFPGEPGDFYALAAQLKLRSYFNLGVDLEAWRLWMSVHGPVMARLICDQNFYNLKPNGILNQYDPTTANGGHAVVIAGYKEGFYLIRNSWGARWGEKGYAWATSAYVEAAFTEGYGLTV